MNPHSTLSVSHPISYRLPGDFSNVPLGRPGRTVKVLPYLAFLGAVFCSVAAAAAVVVHVPLTVMGLWS